MRTATKIDNPCATNSKKKLLLILDFQDLAISAGLPPVKIRYFEKFRFFNILIEKNEKSLKS